MHLRLFEARQVIWPARPAGSLRQATKADEDVLVEFLRGFHRDAELQGGRKPDRAWVPDLDSLRRATRNRAMWLWQVDGVPAHLTAVNPPMFGAARIGPVYTPTEHRGRGYAGWVVAELTQQVLDAGARPCLYTDQANPVSNLVYQRIGYEPVHDEGNVVVV
jgi:predicted GNAT family acetyltransferase